MNKCSFPCFSLYFWLKFNIISSVNYLLSPNVETGKNDKIFALENIFHLLNNTRSIIFAGPLVMILHTHPDCHPLLWRWLGSLRAAAADCWSLLSGLCMVRELQHPLGGHGTCVQAGLQCEPVNTWGYIWQNAYKGNMLHLQQPCFMADIFQQTNFLMTRLHFISLSLLLSKPNPPQKVTATSIHPLWLNSVSLPASLTACVTSSALTMDTSFLPVVSAVCNVCSSWPSTCTNVMGLARPPGQNLREEVLVCSSRPHSSWLL